MEQFKKLNLYIGWIIFAIAAFVYLSTIEPTTSWWDCGEFIASAYKLEVGHPPGAPFFMILARFFSLFAIEEAQVAMMVNAMSGLASAFTILFLFWSISHLAHKIMTKDGHLDNSKMIAIFGASAVGALAYTFSDTFWFSAVEGEVYALSSLFTAVVFWAILKWENVANEPYANRWLIFIAYMMGLSVGVHLLNLLAIPAIVFVYYFKKYEPTRKGFIYALLVSVLILGSIMYVIIPGLITVASWFELAFVNGMGLPYNTGVLVYAALIIGLILWGIKYTREKKKIVLNTVLLVITMIVIGYSSFAMIVIRSLANPPMDENNPETVFSLLSYLNREQYGDRPLMYGQYYNAPIVDQEAKKPVYIQKDGKYVISTRRPEYIYDDRFQTIFPRMYSPQRDHVQAYKEWGNIEGRRVRITNREGKEETRTVPTFGENIRFFVTYQLGHMYFRYFMWNFSGRQNDVQGHGGILKGNWITGINALDKARIGDQENIPDDFKNDPTRNTYYLLPFLLGLAGLIYQYRKHPKDFWVVMLLFILTGIAIVIYLNQYPFQPRERDYAYAGSFYAFTIWIGLGVLALFDWLGKKLNKTVSAIFSTVLCMGLVPGIMAAENWDDHDRSGRYMARDIAHDYLNSCAPNAVLFTNGDNDTFPLWYAQEVEGIRTDVRIVNLSLLNTDWYIDQMKRQAYDSEPVPFSLTHDKYVQGTNDIIYMVERIKNNVDVDKVIDFVASENNQSKLKLSGNEQVDYIPAKRFTLAVDSATVVENGTVKPENAGKILKEINWQFNKRYIQKKDLMILDLLATNDWKRPVYFVSPTRDITLGLNDYMQLEGFAYRLVPIKTPARDILGVGRVDTDILYNKLMNEFKWGNMYKEDVHVCHYTQRTTSVIRIRHNFKRLADNLIEEDKADSAVQVLDRAMEIMPHSKFPYDYYTLGMVESYYNAAAQGKANSLLKEFAGITADKIRYYTSLEKEYRQNIDQEIKLELQLYQRLMALANRNKEKEIFQELQQQFQDFLSVYNQG